MRCQVIFLYVKLNGPTADGLEAPLSFDIFGSLGLGFLALRGNPNESKYQSPPEGSEKRDFLFSVEIPCGFKF
jgi:hypothetical protein